MIGVAFALLSALAVGARAAYPALLERRASRRRALGEDGIVRGAAPIILERDGAPGILLLHGGGDTPQVLSGLAEHLYRRGCSVRVPLLAGHGRQLAALAEVSSETWQDQVREEFELLRATHRSVAVVGLSMGGALAIKLASERTDIGALVLLAPYVDMPAAVKRLAAAARYWGWLLPYFPTGGGQSIHDQAAAAETLGHGVLTPMALAALYEVMSATTDALPRVKAPTLVVQSREDNRIAPEVAERAFARLGAAAKRFVWTDGAGHVITVDFGREQVFELTWRWIRDHLKIDGPVRERTGPSIRPRTPG